jgi:DNA-directed RNA polymerase specialized sigma24 family protein
MDGKKYEEIAEKLDLSVRTVKRYQSQAIEILKKNLQDYLTITTFYLLIN